MKITIKGKFYKDSESKGYVRYVPKKADCEDYVEYLNESLEGDSVKVVSASPSGLTFEGPSEKDIHEALSKLVGMSKKKGTIEVEEDEERGHDGYYVLMRYFVPDEILEPSKTTDRMSDEKFEELSRSREQLPEETQEKLFREIVRRNRKGKRGWYVAMIVGISDNVLDKFLEIANENDMSSFTYDVRQGMMEKYTKEQHLKILGKLLEIGDKSEVGEYSIPLLKKGMLSDDIIKKVSEVYTEIGLYVPNNRELLERAILDKYFRTYRLGILKEIPNDLMYKFLKKKRDDGRLKSEIKEVPKKFLNEDTVAMYLELSGIAVKGKKIHKDSLEIALKMLNDLF